jgi:tetratricopeptide (TPR) repeat protein
MEMLVSANRKTAVISVMRIARITTSLWIGLIVCFPGGVAAFNDTSVTAEPGSLAAGGDIKNNTINQINKVDLTNLPEFVKVFSDREKANQQQLADATKARDEIAASLNINQGAVDGFFQTLGEQKVPPEQLKAKLTEIASQFEVARQRLAALEPDDPATKALVDQAKEALDKGHPDEASGLLQRAEDAELAAANQADVIADQARAAANTRRLHAAKAREGRGDVALTQLGYREAAGHFAAATELLPPSASDERGRLIWRQALVLYQQGDEFGDNVALAESITVWKRLASQDYPRDRVPLDWAMMQMNLGVTLATLGERENGTARLEAAVAAFRAALREYTRDRVPLYWVRTQNNLGNALEALGKREIGTARLEAAVAAYRAALQEYTRDRVPLDWAMTQNNLGNALEALGERENGTARLEAAVAAFRAALREYTRDRVPLYWARTQNNLGNALEVLGERESGTARLEEAVAAYRAALQERTRDRVPLDWARTQNNLGNALEALSERENGTARLEAAVAALRAALQEQTRDRVPLDWAAAQVNLGNTLKTFGERESGTARLEEAVAAYRAALQEYTRDRVPFNWAMTQMNLGGTLATLGERERGTERLKDAIVAFKSALDVFLAAKSGRYEDICRKNLRKAQAVLDQLKG